MIRVIKKIDSISISQYLMKKYLISFKEAEIQVKKLLRSQNSCFIKEDRDIQGLCWIEKIKIDNISIKRLSFLVDNWKLAEDFIKMLRWNLNGIYEIEIPKHDFLNRTLTKNGFRFLKLNNNKNVYHYKFEKKSFTHYKLEDIE